MASTVPVKLTIFASTDGAIAGAMQQELCDRFPRFLETTETVGTAREDAFRSILALNARDDEQLSRPLSGA